MYPRNGDSSPRRPTRTPRTGPCPSRWMNAGRERKSPCSHVALLGHGAASCSARRRCALILAGEAEMRAEDETSDECRSLDQSIIDDWVLCDLPSSSLSPDFELRDKLMVDEAIFKRARELGLVTSERR